MESGRDSNKAFATVFKQRTKQFALRVLKLGDNLPGTLSALTVGRQLVRSASSVAANYRAACRARSDREFAAKLHIALEEADETELWLELLIEGEMVPAERTQALYQEAGEIVAILTTAEQSIRHRIAQKNGAKSNKHQE